MSMRVVDDRVVESGHGTGLRGVDRALAARDGVAYRPEPVISTFVRASVSGFDFPKTQTRKKKTDTHTNSDLATDNISRSPITGKIRIDYYYLTRTQNLAANKR